jgi:FtsP/CotA-like multicopper oxidase with cupredoxin domain
VTATRTALSIVRLAALSAALLLSTAAGAAERRFELAVHDGKLADAPPTLKVTQGDDVVLALTSDRDLELHLHGYSLTMKLTAGKAETWRFAVPTAGRFPLGVHGHDGGHGHATLLYLEVHPG